MVPGTGPGVPFARHGHTDWALPAPRSDNLFWTLILPNLVIVVVILAVVLVLRWSRRAGRRGGPRP